jgi:hypothetical protein
MRRYLFAIPMTPKAVSRWRVSKLGPRLAPQACSKTAARAFAIDYFLTVAIGSAVFPGGNFAEMSLSLRHTPVCQRYERD